MAQMPCAIVINSISGRFKESFMVKAVPRQELEVNWEHRRPAGKMGI